MPDLALHTITTADDPRCPALIPLVEAMYREEASFGSNAVLAPDGAARWLKGVMAGAGWLSTLRVAERDGIVVGFAQGLIRLLPDHLVGDKTGLVQHVYVAPDHRRAGIAQALVRELDAWFTERNVARLELVVVPGNAAALAFWRSLGFTIALHQLERS